MQSGYGSESHNGLGQSHSHRNTTGFVIDGDGDDHGHGLGRNLGHSHGHDHGHDLYRGHDPDHGRGLDHGLCRGHDPDPDRVLISHRILRIGPFWTICPFSTIYLFLSATVSLCHCPGSLSCPCCDGPFYGGPFWTI